MFELKDIKDYLQVIIAGVTVLGLLYQGLRWGYRQYKDLRKMHGMVETMFSELTPNHGGSVKDKIDALDECVKEQNAAIMKLVRRQKWILNNEPRLIFEIDAEGLFKWCNKKFKDFVKRDQSFLDGNGWKNIIHDEDRAVVVNKFTSCISDGITYEDTFRICNKNGECFNIRCVVYKVDDTGYMGTLEVLDNTSFFQ